MNPFYDLASLTKPLVTAPLALRHLELDVDRRERLGFEHRPEPLTVRQLLSHSAGLPPWLPFTGRPLPEQLSCGFPAGAHPLLREGHAGTAVYSDLGYRLLADLLEMETVRPFAELGAEATGLEPAPWAHPPVSIPDGPDAEAWRLAAPHRPLPPQAPGLPQDANARAGMRGHAGFGATAQTLRAWLIRWIAEGFPQRMAQETARSEENAPWGLGLQRSRTGSGRFGSLLARLPSALSGVHVLESAEDALPEAAPALEPEPGPPTEWWMHFGFTGPALFVRPADGLCVALLAHRRGPAGELIDAEQLRTRRWAMLEGFARNLS